MAEFHLSWSPGSGNSLIYVSISNDSIVVVVVAFVVGIHKYNNAIKVYIYELITVFLCIIIVINIIIQHNMLSIIITLIIIMLIINNIIIKSTYNDDKDN